MKTTNEPEFNVDQQYERLLNIRAIYLFLGSITTSFATFVDFNLTK